MLVNISLDYQNASEEQIIEAVKGAREEAEGWQSPVNYEADGATLIEYENEDDDEGVYWTIASTHIAPGGSSLQVQLTS